MSASFGHIKRQEKRKTSHQKDGLRAKQIILENLRRYQPLTNNVTEYYQHIDSVFRQEFTTANRYRIARVKLLRFVRGYNQKHTQQLPEPVVPLRIQRAQPVKGLQWLIQGQALSLLVDAAIQYWQQQSTYAPEEVLGWTLFSAIIFGGLNDQAALNDFLNALLEDRPIECWQHEQNLVYLSAYDVHYGNQLEKDLLTRSYSFVIDDVTRCWLWRLKQDKPSFKKKLTVEQLLNLIFKQLNSPIKITTAKQLKTLLTQASYYWEQVLGARVDSALYRVLTAQQPSCSLTQQEFSIFYRPSIKQIDHEWQLDVQKLLKGEFPKLERRQISTEQKQAKSITTLIRKAFESDDPSTHLDQIITQQDHEATKRLVAWIHELVTQAKPKKLKKSSILRYMDAVAHPWLVLTSNVDILDFESIDYEDVYQEILSHKSTAGQSYDATQLHRFHQFQIQKFKAPFIHFNLKNQKQVCRARIISPIVFKAACHTIKHLTGIDEPHRRIFLLILILAYRTGMRREEIIGLQFKDIERGEQISLIIRANTSGGIKTNSAYRRIPIYALLKPDELRLFRNYLTDHYKEENSRLNAVVFSASNSHFPLPKELPSRLFKTLMNQILDNHDYSFHSLRHSAINNLGLILNASDELIQHLTDYTPEQVIEIRRALLGKQHCGQDRWFALAQVAGHLTPDITFQHYIHLAHIMAGDALQQVNIQLPYQAVHNITGLITRQITNKTKGAFTDNYSNVNLKSLRPLLTRQLSAPDSIQLASSTGSFYALEDQDINDDAKNTILFTQLPGSQLHPLSMMSIHTILKKIESGISIEVAAANFFVPIELVEIWLTRAKLLASLKTQRGELKLFDKKRINNQKNLLLLPAKPPSKSEQLLLSEFFRQGALLHHHDKERLHQFLRFFLEKVSATKADFRFSHKQKNDLKLFFELGQQLISLSNWRLKAENLEAARLLKKELKLPASLTIDIHKGSIFKGYSLSITHPDEKNMLSKSKIHQNFSSGILKYGCHMLLIADLNYHLN